MFARTPPQVIYQAPVFFISLTWYFQSKYFTFGTFLCFTVGENGSSVSC